ncbi:o-succinylbenzoate synthase [Cellulomonas marina]|uniref:o-succinylbenzoate synthase n=1 Tax=Cellulomonas marina TaxID=988821 RepID=A0A1I0Z4S3_9CELL|nr:o-succinylbenzoate synthase [Cellulomonas marina]GIG28219.1 o-succinylbenzoate synthase [Cellulomonas marina]SFB20096.1 O-succinylbenzoate synthase [Cellulomonas marina]
MRVVEATATVVRLPLVHAFTTSSHAKSWLQHVLVELVAEDGTVGWGEIASPSGPFYSSETVGTTLLVAREHLLPALLRAEWEHPREATEAWRKVRGHEFAKAGVDAACWTLWAQAQGVPLATALGGTRTEVPVGVSLGIEPTVDALLEQVQLQVDAGYGRVKLKIAPGWDAEPVAAVRAAFPDHDLHVDANGAYPATDEAFAVLAGLDRYGLTMVEQPFGPRDFLSHAALAERMDTPVCLDESVVALDDLRTMLALRAGSILNIKVSRMGGLTPALAAHDLAREHDVPVWCGGMHEFGVGRAANLALSSLPGFSLPSDVSGSGKYYARDVVVPPVVSRDGVTAVPTGPGLGFDVDRDWVIANAQSSTTFRLDGGDVVEVPSGTRTQGA